MEPFSYESEIPSEDFVGWCVRDRDQLTTDFLILRPSYAGLPPALWVEELLGALDYKVAFCPMEAEQLGLCDLANRHVFVNSRAGDKKIDKHYRSSTLAHELGHIRLHEKEIQEIVCHDDDLSRSRRYRREREADAYASIFLVCPSELEQHPLAQNIQEARSAGQNIPSSVIWSSIYRLAQAFAVSPTMMMRRLLDLDWIEKTPSRSKARKTNLQIKGRAYYD